MGRRNICHVWSVLPSKADLDNTNVELTSAADGQSQARALSPPAQHTPLPFRAQSSGPSQQPPTCTPSFPPPSPHTHTHTHSLSTCPHPWRNSPCQLLSCCFCRFCNASVTWSLPTSLRITVSLHFSLFCYLTNIPISCLNILLKLDIIC